MSDSHADPSTTEVSNLDNMEHQAHNEWKLHCEWEANDGNKRILGYLQSRGFPLEDAQDALSLAVITAHKKYVQLGKVSDWRAYRSLVLTIAERIALKLAKDRKREIPESLLPQRHEEWDDSGDSGIERFAENAILQDLHHQNWVEESFREYQVTSMTLSPTEQAAFDLRHYYEYTYEEIGKFLKVSISNARQLVHRAKSKLRARMGPKP